MGKEIHRIVQEAVDARNRDESLADTDVYRLINSSGDGLPGITADKLGPLLLIERHFREAEVEPVIEALSDLFTEAPVFLKERWSRDPDLLGGKQVLGPPGDGAQVVVENGLRFRVNPLRGEHIGLFLDGRRVRREVRSLSSGKRVLNLFSYTGGFGVAAAKGGARSTTNVDNKKSALYAAKENYELNSLLADTRTFMRDDTKRFLSRAAKGSGRYDLVVLDPPPRYRVSRDRLVDAKSAYGNLVQKCIAVLEEGGALVLGLNKKPGDDDGFESLVLDAVRVGWPAAEIRGRLGPGEDFPDSSDRPVARFIVVS